MFIKIPEALYEAVKQGKVNIIMENTDRAQEMLGQNQKCMPRPWGLMQSRVNIAKT